MLLVHRKDRKALLKSPASNDRTKKQMGIRSYAHALPPPTHLFILPVLSHPHMFSTFFA